MRGFLDKCLGSKMIHVVQEYTMEPDCSKRGAKLKINLIVG